MEGAGEASHRARRRANIGTFEPWGRRTRSGAALYKLMIACAALAFCVASLPAQAAPPPSAAVQARRTAEALYDQAGRQWEASDVEGARESLDAALKQDATFDPARLARVYALASLGQMDAALADLVVLEPRMVREKFLEVKGEALLESGRYREAIATYTDLILSLIHI